MATSGAHGQRPAIALLSRGDADARRAPGQENTRLRPIFAALADLGATVEFAVYSEEREDEVREQLVEADGVLVWVDPVSGDRDRSRLDPLLRDLAQAGVWVSAHPDVILAMGTKTVLFRTRDLGWSADTHLYRSAEELAAALPGRLTSGPRVLKPERGNGGIGVWKVSAIAGHGPAEQSVRVQHARDRDTVTEDLDLQTFVERCRHYFVGGACLVDQAFQPRINEGMIRCYLVQDEVVGFARQVHDDPTAEVFGIPAAKTMYPAAEPEFQILRSRLEHEWLPEMQRWLSVETASLPVLWDADFLHGPKTDDGHDSYVLCEINVSSVTPFPPQAVPKLARATLARIEACRVAAQ